MRRTRGFVYPAAAAVLAMMAVVVFGRPAELAEAHAGDSFKFSSATYNVVEGNQFSLTILRTTTGSAAHGHNVVVEFGALGDTAVDGIHYGQNAGCSQTFDTIGVTFGSNEASKAVPVRTCIDGLSTADRTFTVEIMSVSDDGVVGTPSETTVTITDIDGPQPANITSINPTAGTTAGGTVVTINGSGFTGTNTGTPCPAVTFDGTPALSCGNISGGGTQMTATAPPHGAGGVNLVVDNDNGPSNAVTYTYQTPGAPFITSVNPASGGIGQSVIIAGGNFGSNPEVTFGSVAATTVTVNGAGTQITAVAPTPVTTDRPHAVRVIVEANGMQSPDSANDSYTYTNISVTGLSPSSGPEGITVSVFGTNFSGTPAVTFGGVPATNVQVINSTELRVTVPVPDSTSRPITRNVVVTIGGTSSANTVNDDFTYVDVTVTDISPETGPPGTVVTITGSGFTATPIVKFGTVTAVVNNFTSTTISAVAPAQGAGTVDVSVQVGSVVSDNTTADNYLYTLGVTVTSLTPNKGPVSGGNTVIVNGTGFLAGATITVSFGGTPGTSVQRVSDTELTVVAPAHTAGVVSVIVTVNGASSPDGTPDDYTYAQLPVVTSISPSSGPAGGTTIVTIIGLNFAEGSVVKFGDIQAVRTIVSETEIAAVAPNTAPPGTVNVTVTNAAGTSVTGSHTIFTFTGTGGLPVVSSLSPSAVGLNSTVEVTITGANFSTPATVKFGGVDATNVQVLSANQIKATAPARGTAGVVEVTVTTGAGTSSTAGSGNDFTYGSGSSGLTTTYQLFVRFTLITWDGRDNIAVADALRGQESPDNSATNNVFGTVTAVFFWSDTGAGCPGLSACWLGFFPNGISVPGANNLLALFRGNAYWVAVAANVNWTVARQ